jgi:hypothetical protein
VISLISPLDTHPKTLDSLFRHKFKQLYGLVVLALVCIDVVAEATRPKPSGDSFYLSDIPSIIQTVLYSVGFVPIFKTLNFYVSTFT